MTVHRVSGIEVLKFMREHEGEWVTADHVAAMVGCSYSTARETLYNHYYHLHTFERRKVRRNGTRVFQYMRRVNT
jgi:hypothetical protein